MKIVVWGVVEAADSRRHNFCHSLATFLVSRGKAVKTIQGLLRHSKVTTTLDLYSQSIDAAKLEAQEDIALAITSTAAAE
jgi:site-specific recombinase XerD